MRIEKEIECGYWQAIHAIGYSHGVTKGTPSDFECYGMRHDVSERLERIAKKLVTKDGGEDKFLRQIFLGFYIKAPFYFWKQLDTYKVGTVAQSSSSMHSIAKNPFDVTNFEGYDKMGEGTKIYLSRTIAYLNELRAYYLEIKDTDPERAKVSWRDIISILPESYLQERYWTTNYAVLKNIYQKRRGHRLNEWRYFIERTFETLDHKELLEGFLSEEYRERAGSR